MQMCLETLKDFNSSVVRLKEFVGYPPFNVSVNFNSSVVRLKVSKQKAIDATILEFQFQCGAIKRFIICRAMSFGAVISIPVWCD